MKDFVGYYALLEIRENAQPEQIQSAYDRKVLLKTDLRLDDKVLAELRLLDEAKETLLDPFKKTIYYLRYMPYQFDQLNKFVIDEMGKIVSEAEDLNKRYKHENL